MRAFSEIGRDVSRAMARLHMAFIGFHALRVMRWQDAAAGWSESLGEGAPRRADRVRILADGTIRDVMAQDARPIAVVALDNGRSVAWPAADLIMLGGRQCQKR